MIVLHMKLWYLMLDAALCCRLLSCIALRGEKKLLR